MAGFKNIGEITKAIDAGRYSITAFRKVTNASGQAVWYDLAPVGPNPSPFYYASTPLEARSMSRADGGINYGPYAPEGMTKHILSWSAYTNALEQHILCDYLLYYPFIEQGELTRQNLIQTATLPRYTDGEGVQMMAVGVASGDAYYNFRVGYTNSEGVSGRVTPDHRSQAGNAYGFILTSFGNVNLPGFAGPFMTLQAGDTGVRSIEYVEVLQPSAGLFTMVLVKPLATLAGPELNQNERNYAKDFPILPEIKNGAYLNLIGINGTGSNSSVSNGIIETVWN